MRGRELALDCSQALGYHAASSSGDRPPMRQFPDFAIDFRPLKDAAHETHVPAEQACPQAPPWVPRPDGDQGRAQGRPAPPLQGPQAAVGLTSPLISGERPKLIFLRKRADFLAAQTGERAQSKSFLLVRRRRNDAEPSIRAGFTVTRKLGKAVVRNRIKRRLRAAARAMLAAQAEAGCDYVFIARAAAYDRTYVDLLDDLRRALLSLARNAI